MKSWFVYILRCSDGTLYTGISNDLQKRIKRHNIGTGAKYTRSRLPVQLVWSKKLKSESTARKKEGQIKKLSRNEKKKLFLS